MPLLQMVHMTAAYSNAVLVAILPHVNDFAKKMDLPIPLPITLNDVSKFNCDPLQSHIGGGIWLTNKYLFSFENGIVVNYRAPDNFFFDESFPIPMQKYSGKDNMTTNDAIELARDSLKKLGYDPKDLHTDVVPFSLQGSFNMHDGHHVPYCEIRWIKESDDDNSYATFQINMQTKQVVGLSVISRKIWKINPQVDVIPELESDFKKKHAFNMFTDTNAPSHIN